MPKNILIIEDDDDDFVLLEAALSDYSHQFNLIWAPSFEDGLRELNSKNMDCCITDYYLGHKTGFDVIREAIKIGFNGPLIMLTGAQYSENIDEEALSIGADDYLSKSEINPALLKRTLLFNIQRKENELLFRASEAKYRQMAEISSSTLHNIGNVLNSLTISSEAMDELLVRIESSRLGEIADLLEEKQMQSNDPRAKLVPKYLREVKTSINSGASTIRNAVQESLARLKMAGQAIAVQQNSVRSGNNESYPVIDVVNEALMLHRSKIFRDNIECIVNGSEKICIYFERAALLHILINLIKNAIDALYQANTKTIRVDIVRTTHLEIRVTDTGQGIDSDVLSNLFKHGYTTKSSGNGFGLHFCRQVLEREGGTIEAFSDGLNQGACFQIKIPS